MLLLAYALLAGWRLAEPPQQIFDEIHHAYAALEMQDRDPTHARTHPLFPVAVTALVIKASGTAIPPTSRPEFDGTATWPPATVWWWRVPTLAMAVVALAALFGAGRTLGLAAPFALLATAMLALDGCFFVMSRTYMTNVWELAWQMLAVAAVVRGIGGDRRWFLAAATIAGVAIGTRLTSAPFTLLLALWLAWRLRGDRPRFAYACAAFVLGTPLVYLASWAPVVAIGPAPGAWDLLDPHAWWTRVILAQANLVTGHMGGDLSAFPGNSAWWTWPLMNEPIWFWQLREQGGMFRGVWAIGNPFLWWASVPALAVAARAGWKGNENMGLLAWLGFGVWGAWAVIPQEYKLAHYYLPTIPYACLALATHAEALWRQPRGDDAGRGLVVIFCCLLVSWFGWFYPLLSGYPIPLASVGSRIWLGEAWIQ